MKDKRAFETLSEAISALQQKGYTENLNFCDTGLENRRKSCVYPAAEIDVKEFYRFEGKSNPDDNSILYAVETEDGHKGLLVDAYGAYSGNIPKAIIDKLKIDR